MSKEERRKQGFGAVANERKALSMFCCVKWLRTRRESTRERGSSGQSQSSVEETLQKHGL